MVEDDEKTVETDIEADTAEGAVSAEVNSSSKGKIFIETEEYSEKAQRVFDIH